MLVRWSSAETGSAAEGDLKQFFRLGKNPLCLAAYLRNYMPNTAKRQWAAEGDLPPGSEETLGKP